MSEKTTEQKETVNHPNHYHPGTYEAINVIEAWGLGFNLGNTVKYVSRYKTKNVDLEKQIEDLKKAAWYLNREIEILERLKFLTDGTKHLRSCSMCRVDQSNPTKVLRCIKPIDHLSECQFEGKQ